MRGMHHAGTHIVSFDTKRLGVKHTTQILDTRQARNTPFTMDYHIIIVLLIVLLSSSDVVKGSLKSKSSASFNVKNLNVSVCTTCKVTREVANQTVPVGKRATLKCAFQGVHYGNITWLRKNKQLKTTKKFVISEWQHHSGINGSKLRIRKVTSKDAGSYSCVGHNSRDQYVVTTGYVRISQANPAPYNSVQLTTPSVASTKQKNGKCEIYTGKICSSYIQGNVLIFVEEGTMNSQEFIEKKLEFGYRYMLSNFTKSCRPLVLPLWCYHNLPICTVVNSRAEPKPICKSECRLIQNSYCNVEYDGPTSRNFEDDLFPDCNRLPNEDPLQMNCLSLKRHVSSLQQVPSVQPASGKCMVYSGDVCKNKHGRKVFVQEGEEISEIEKIIETETLKQRGFVSKECQSYVQPLLCQLRLPDCDESSAKPKGKPICRDECLVLKNKFCKKEYSDAEKRGTPTIFINCLTVAPLTIASGKCSRIGVPEEYLGSLDISSNPSKRPMIGRCQPYTGSICRKYMNNKNIFVEVDNHESNIEQKLKIALRNIRNYPDLSPRCEPFVLPLMCYHLLPFCESDSQPKPKYICRRDCFRVQQDFCMSEYPIAEYEKLTGGSILFPSCNLLPVSNERCTSLHELFAMNKTEPAIHGDCYPDNGVDYRGFTNITENGAPCERWTSAPELLAGHNFCRNPKGRGKKPWCVADGKIQLCNIPQCDTIDAPLNGTGVDYNGILANTKRGPCQPWNEHEPQHNWAHNYCRNPKGNKKEKPWCYIAKGKWEYCDIPKVSAKEFPDSSGHLSNLLYTVIPCVVFGMIVAIVIIAICWKRHKQGPDAIKKNTRLTVTVLLPELRTIPAENILLPKFLGNGKFGAMYSGEICSEDGSRVGRLVKVALKDSREDFINQAKVWSQLHHPNLLTIEAITSGSEPMTLVYEPAGHGSLYQYLIYHSPNNPNFTRDHALLDRANLLDISRQIAAGMAYLSSHGYVHGELMTRNCQVAHSMVIKITDFTVDRDVCYFRQQNKRPIALGWMAPETIQTETYTVYSDVWAFGILLWEIFTYGFQPYFGFTFPEVREKILNMVLLEQPRDCIPVIYELMRNCWTKTPTHRPQFADLHEDLNSLCNEYLEEDDDDEHDSCYVTAVNL